MPILKTKIAKTQVGRTVTPDGTRIREDKQKIHIENGGDLRLVMFLPRFVVEALGDSGVKTAIDAGGHHDREQIKLDYTHLPGPSRFDSRKGDPGIVGNVTTDALEKAYDRVLEAFMEKLRNENVVPKIMVRLRIGIRGDRNFPVDNFRGANVDFEMQLEARRYLKGNADTYAWRDDPSQTLRREHISYGEKNAQVLEYTDELWDRLQDMRNNLANSARRLHEIVYGKDFTGLLLSGAIAALPAPRAADDEL